MGLKCLTHTNKELYRILYDLVKKETPGHRKPIKLIRGVSVTDSSDVSLTLGVRPIFGEVTGLPSTESDWVLRSLFGRCLPFPEREVSRERTGDDPVLNRKSGSSKVGFRQTRQRWGSGVPLPWTWVFKDLGLPWTWVFSTFTDSVYRSVTVLGLRWVDTGSSSSGPYFFGPKLRVETVTLVDLRE